MKKRLLGLTMGSALVFSIFACSGEDGKDGINGVDGKDGTSCAMKALKDESGFKVVCDGDSVGVIKNGENGKDGSDGKDGTDGDGKSCNAVALEDSTGYKILCGGDSVGVVLNGEKGDAGKSAFEIAQELDPTITDEAAWIASLKGESCTASTVTNGVKITCPGSSAVTITNGTGCEVSDPSNAAYITVTCGTSSTTIAKAYCGSTAFDPSAKFCFEGATYALCGTASYNPETQFCDTRTANNNTPRVYGMNKIEIYNADVQYSATWMTENIAYDPGSNYRTKCRTTDCADGRYYSYAASMLKTEAQCGEDKSDASCYTDGKVQGVCPSGWHIATKADWKSLFAAVKTESDLFDNGEDLYSEDATSGGVGMLTGDGIYGIKLGAYNNGYIYNWSTDAWEKYNSYWVLSKLDSPVQAGGQTFYYKDYGMTVIVEHTGMGVTHPDWIEITGLGDSSRMKRGNLVRVRCVKN